MRDADVLGIKVMLRISQKVKFLLLFPSRLRRSHAKQYHGIADIISTVEFDHTGDYLATGDKGGRVVLFERFEGVLNLQHLVCAVMLTFCVEKGMRIQILQ